MGCSNSDWVAKLCIVELPDFSLAQRYEAMRFTPTPATRHPHRSLEEALRLDT